MRLRFVSSLFELCTTKDYHHFEGGAFVDERRLRDAVTSQLCSRLPFWSHFDHGHDSTARLVVDTHSTVGIPEGPTPHPHGFPTEASGTPLDVFASDVLCCTSPFVHQAFILSTPASKPLFSVYNALRAVFPPLPGWFRLPHRGQEELQGATVPFRLTSVALHHSGGDK